MTTLTIYTPDYDKYEDVVNNGMSNKAFLDMDNKLGTPFDNLDSALDYVFNNNISIHRIEFNYVDKDGVQMFKKFDVVVQ
jgi:hypothetical protein